MRWMRKLDSIGSVGDDDDEVVAAAAVEMMSTLPMDTGAAAARRPDRRGAMGVQASGHVAYVQERAQHSYQNRTMTIRVLIGNQRREKSQAAAGIESAHSRRCWCARVSVMDEWELKWKEQR